MSCFVQVYVQGRTWATRSGWCSEWCPGAPRADQNVCVCGVRFDMYGWDVPKHRGLPNVWPLRPPRLHPIVRMDRLSAAPGGGGGGAQGGEHVGPGAAWRPWTD